MSRALLGSGAESVVRLAPCPVLTVPLAVVGAGAPKAGAAEAPPSDHCIVCGHEAEDLICETCRIRIRGEVLERKLEAERAGGRGSPV